MNATFTTTSTAHPTTDMTGVKLPDPVAAELQGRRAQAIAMAVAIGQIVAPITAAFRSLARAWAHQGDVARAYSQLRRFDDRMLADIGLDRANLLASLQQREALNRQAISRVAGPKAVAPIDVQPQVKPAANLDHPSAKPSRAA